MDVITPAPGPSTAAFLRVLLAARRDRLRFVESMRQRYGDLVRFRFGHRVIYLISHPALARHVLYDNASNYVKGFGLREARQVFGDGLLTSDGDEWSWRRHDSQPLFERRALARYDAVVRRNADDLVARLDRMAGWPDPPGPGAAGSLGSRGSPAVEVRPEEVFSEVALSTLVACLFHADLGQAAHDLSAAARWLADEAMRRALAPWPGRAWVPPSRLLRFRRTRRWMGEALRDATRHLPRDFPHDEVRTLVFAGHETTASALSWAFCWVARNGEAQERVRHEALRDAEDGKLRYTRMVVRECLRLSPPVWAVPRRSIEADELGGHRVDAGADVIVNTYSIHRDPRFWVRPEEFRPERFAGRAAVERPPGTYLPFGTGPRQCIGRSLGSLQVELMLAAVLRRFRVTLVGSTDDPPQLNLTLGPPPTWRLRLGPLTGRRNLPGMEDDLGAKPDGERRLESPGPGCGA